MKKVTAYENLPWVTKESRVPSQGDKILYWISLILLFVVIIFTSAVYIQIAREIGEPNERVIKGTPF